MNQLDQERKNLNKKRLKGCRFASKLLASFPFVRCVILNGSLAEGRSKLSSDIDLLIIVKPGRIFTARFFIISIAALLGIKRSKDDQLDHSGKYCFNYFLTENFLKIPTGRGEDMDRYCAHNYGKSIFMAGEANLFTQFLAENQSLFSKYKVEPRALTDNSFPKSKRLQHIFEFLLNGHFGDWLESRFKNYQLNRIMKDERTKRFPLLIVANDREMRFHPPKNQNLF